MRRRRRRVEVGREQSPGHKVRRKAPENFLRVPLVFLVNHVNLFFTDMVLTKAMQYVCNDNSCLYDGRLDQIPLIN